MDAKTRRSPEKGLRLCMTSRLFNAKLRVKQKHTRCVSQSKNSQPHTAHTHAEPPQHVHVSFTPWYNDTILFHELSNVFQHFGRHFVTVAKRQGFETIVSRILPPQIGGYNGVGKNVLKDQILTMFADQTNCWDGFGREPHRTVFQPVPFHAFLSGQFGVDLIACRHVPRVFVGTSNGGRRIVLGRQCPRVTCPVGDEFLQKGGVMFGRVSIDGRRINNGGFTPTFRFDVTVKEDVSGWVGSLGQLVVKGNRLVGRAATKKWQTMIRPCEVFAKRLLVFKHH